MPGDVDIAVLDDEAQKLRVLWRKLINYASTFAIEYRRQETAFVADRYLPPKFGDWSFSRYLINRVGLTDQTCLKVILELEKLASEDDRLRTRSSLSEIARQKAREKAEEKHRIQSTQAAWDAWKADEKQRVQATQAAWDAWRKLPPQLQTAIAAMGKRPPELQTAIAETPAPRRGSRERNSDPDRNEKARLKVVQKKGILELQEVCPPFGAKPGPGQLPLTTCERIAKMPPEIQLAEIQKAFANPNVRSYRGRRRSTNSSAQSRRRRVAKPATNGAANGSHATPIDGTGLAAEIKAAQAQIDNGRKDWIAGVVRLATAMAQGRGRYDCDNDLGAWLVANDIRYNPHDRAALIGMGQNIDATRVVLQHTKRQSFKHIWREEVEPSLLDPRFVQVDKPDMVINTHSRQ